MTLRFVLVDDVTNAERATAAAPPVDGGKRALLVAIGAQLQAPAYFSGDSLDGFFDVLVSHNSGVPRSVWLINATAWWQQQPVLMSQVAQCFIDAGNHIELVCAM